MGSVPSLKDYVQPVPNYQAKKLQPNLEGPGLKVEHEPWSSG